jgi:hypothetical protein
MGIFGTLFKTAIDVVVLPIAVVKDVVTLGGELTEEESSVKSKLEDIKQDLDELTD